MENLTGIRKTVKHVKSFRYSLNSWSYYQLQQFIKYKARLQGIEIVSVDPRYTSKMCSIVDSVVNTTKTKNMNQLHVDRDACKGSTDAPKGNSKNERDLKT